MSDGSTPNGHGFDDEPDKLRPEYVILDEEAFEREQRQSGSHFEDISAAVGIKVPWVFRIFFFIVAFFSALLAALSLAGWAISSVGYTLTLYRSDALRKWTQIFWTNLMRTAVISIGFLISILSPPLGTGFIMLYCMLHEDSEAILAKTMRSNFSRFK